MYNVFSSERRFAVALGGGCVCSSLLGDRFTGECLGKALKKLKALAVLGAVGVLVILIWNSGVTPAMEAATVTPPSYQEVLTLRGWVMEADSNVAVLEDEHTKICGALAPATRCPGVQNDQGVVQRLGDAKALCEGRRSEFNDKVEAWREANPTAPYDPLMEEMGMWLSRPVNPQTGEKVSCGAP